MSFIRNSAHWMPYIEQLCDGFRQKRLTSDHHTYKEDVFPVVDGYYNMMIGKLKQEIYFNHPNATDCLLDRHKITAVHILGILINQPFLKEGNMNGDTYFDILPNEHFCLLLLQAILLEWHKDPGVEVSVGLPLKYKDCLLLLFRQYRRSRSPQTDDVAFAYALANIVYLIESHFVTITQTVVAAPPPALPAVS